MRLAAFIILIVLASGCLCAGPTTSTTTTTSSTATTSSVTHTTVTTTTTSTTTTLLQLKSLPRCDELWAALRDVGVRCYDDYALANNDISYCRSDHCYAYMSGDPTVCGGGETKIGNITCQAIAAKEPKACQQSLAGQECLFDYSVLIKDLSVCNKSFSQTWKGECYGRFAAARLDLALCSSGLSTNDKRLCEDQYWWEYALFMRNQTFCGRIRVKQDSGQCVLDVRKAVEENGTDNHLRILGFAPKL